MGGKLTHIIVCLENKNDCRRITDAGWNEYPDSAVG